MRGVRDRIKVCVGEAYFESDLEITMKIRTMGDTLSGFQEEDETITRIMRTMEITIIIEDAHFVEEVL
jgi:hypothetical protein